MISSVVPALLVSAVLGGSPRGVVLDFSATWCGPCQQMNPIVSRLERQGYSIRKVDVDKKPELAQRFNVSSIPAFVLVVDGKEVTRITGATSEEQLKRLLAQIPADLPPVAATPPAQQAPDESVAVGFEEPTRFAQIDSEPPQNVPQQRPQPAPLTQTETAPEAEPARSGNLFGRLWGRKDAAAQIEQRDVRATDGELDEPINLLPVRNPLRASVRLHVTINGQTSVGSGTAIDSRPGRTVIATCGHLFRGWNDQQSKIEVDVFTETGIKKFVGRMVSYSCEADVGIVMLNTEGYIATAEVPDVAGRPQTRDEVVNIGCSGGAPPTQEAVQVTALNYFEGPDNIECTGVPVQGRSGGGLFNQQGQLVGICIGADAQRQRGAYAGLLALHDQLDDAGLSDLYRSTAPANQPPPQYATTAQESASPADRLAPQTPAESAFAENAITDGARDRMATQPAVAQPPFEPVTEASAATVAAAGDAEVICIIRDRTRPGAPSRVVIIDRASPTFLNYLGGEVKPTAMDSRSTQLPITRANRIPHEETSGYSRVTDPDSMFQRGDSQRPLFPSSDGASLGSVSRAATLQPTSLEEKQFTPERYLRTR